MTYLQMISLFVQVMENVLHMINVNALEVILVKIAVKFHPMKMFKMVKNKIIK